MKITGFEMITILIVVSNIIEGETIKIEESKWISEDPGRSGRLAFLTTTRDCVNQAGKVEGCGEWYPDRGIHGLSVTNNPNERAISLTNNLNQPQTYKVHDRSRSEKPYLFLNIRPKDTHVFDVVAKKFDISVLVIYVHHGCKI
jgi:hypothetical protein